MKAIFTLTIIQKTHPAVQPLKEIIDVFEDEGAARMATHSP